MNVKICGCFAFSPPNRTVFLNNIFFWENAHKVCPPAKGSQGIPRQFEAEISTFLHFFPHYFCCLMKLFCYFLKGNVNDYSKHCCTMKIISPAEVEKKEMFIVRGGRNRTSMRFALFAFFPFVFLL